MWSPYKELLVTVEAVLSKPDGNVPPKFIELLKRHKQNFITLLKNPVSMKSFIVEFMDFLNGHYITAKTNILDSLQWLKRI